MFISVIVESGSVDSGEAIFSILSQFGFKKVQKFCWENMNFAESSLSLLKKNIDNITDYYDTIRFYQFPINDMFVITELRQKKWRRCQFKSAQIKSPVKKNPPKKSVSPK